MSLAHDLSSKILRRVVDGVGATEVLGADGGPFLDAVGDGSTGTMRLFGTDDGAKVVATTLAVPARDVVTCMVFAFSSPESAVPHFTLDCSDRPDGHAFHLDLMPKVELSTHVPYMDEVFGPLTAALQEGRAIEGLSRTGTTPRQFAMMSPWMLVHLADESAFRAIDPVVRAYADRWVDLMRSGLTADVLATTADTDIAARDVAVRANLFSPSIDPVWGRVSAMIGDEAAAIIRAQLEGTAALR